MALVLTGSDGEMVIYRTPHNKIGRLEMKLDFAKRASKALGIPMPADD